MKKTLSALLLGLVLFASATLMAQGVRVTSSSYHQSVVSFEAPALHMTNTTVGSDTYTTLTFDGSTPSSELGRANLPLLSQVISVPVCSNVKVSVSNIQTKTLEPLKHRLMPVQPAPSKSDKGPRPFVIDQAWYATDGGDARLAWVDPMGVARDRNLAVLRVSPIIYNPLTGELSQVTAMTITLTFEGADAAATQQLFARYHTPDFAVTGQVLSCTPQPKAVRNDAPIHYLIVSHSSFRGQLDSFINWKKRQGFLVTVAYTDETGVGTTANEIAQFTRSFYDNATDALPAPTYLLLVGDHQQIPAFSSRCTAPAQDHVTDLYYVSWTTGDNIPDCYLGRFSARTVAELTPQIEKTLYYEGYNFDNDDYLSRGVLIAGEDGGYTGDNAYRYADPAMDYIAKYYINEANGYTNVTYYKNNTSFAPTGVTVNGSCSASSTSAALRSLYNTGIGWINYSAHGYDNSWSNPSFTATNASAMTNVNMPSIMIGNCCLSGKFNTSAYDACLGEALLRKGDNAGAVAYFGGTNSTYWPHDFCWSVGVRTGITNTMDAAYDAQNLGMYDALFHTHAEPQSAWHTTAGSMVTAGNMAVEGYGSYQLYYWEIYELFGDPSLMPYLAKATDLIVNSSEIIPVGSTTYTVNTEPYAYVALTTAEDHDFVAAAYADASGSATLSLPSDLAPGEYELAAWAQNRKPYFSTVTVTVLDGPYVSIVSIQPNGSLLADSVCTFNITLTNAGNAAPTRGLLSFASNQSCATIINPEARFTSCNPGDTVVVSAVFPTYIAADAMGNTQVRFTATVDFGGSSPSSRSAAFPVVAPSVVVTSSQIAPALQVGAQSNIDITVANEGQATLDAPIFTLVNDFGFVQAISAPVSFNTFAPNQRLSLSYTVFLDESAPDAEIPFYLYCTSGDRTFLVQQLSFRSGSAAGEDFESNTLVENIVNSSNNAWVVTSSDSHTGSKSFRSANNLGDRQSSVFHIDFTSSSDDSISFWYRVSSESNYDFFLFAIDGGENLIEASGNVSWTRASFPVSAGQHRFTFSYEKDYSTARGEDAAFIDDIVFPFSGDVCTYAIDTVCQDAEYMFNGQSVNTSQEGVQSLADGHNYLALHVMPTPTVTIETRQYAGSVLLVAHGATSYVWSTGDTADHIAVLTDRQGEYSVTGYRGGCSAEASVSLLSIHEAAQQPSVSLYPNPAQAQAVITSTEVIRSAQVVNLMGQAVMNLRGNGTTLSIDLSHVPAGVYFVRVDTGAGIQVKKLVRK